MLLVRLHLRTSGDVQPRHRLHGLPDDGGQSLPVFDRERRNMRGLPERGEPVDDTRGIAQRAELAFIPGMRLHVDGAERSDRFNAIGAKRHAGVGAHAQVSRGEVLAEQGMTAHI